MWRRGELYREEYPEYPMRAVKEAIVNALIHRDYSVIGSEVHVDIFDDRMEITSPGGMYDGTFIQDKDPYTISSTRRNPILADIFGRMELMERRGSGLKKIIESYEFERNYNESLKPEFISTRSTFCTILKNLNYDFINDSKEKIQNFTVTQNEVAKMGREERLNKILELIVKNPNIAKKKIAKILGVAESTVKRDVLKLREDGKIKYLGSAKKGKWINEE